MAYKHSLGQPTIYPKNELSYASNFLNMCFGVPTEDKDVDDINEFERKLFDKKGLPYEIDSRYESTYFSHIFAGGYSSSYYSYMWSEVLDSSAFEGFEKNGLFSLSCHNNFVFPSHKCKFLFLFSGVHSFYLVRGFPICLLHRCISVSSSYLSTS